MPISPLLAQAITGQPIALAGVAQLSSSRDQVARRSRAVAVTLNQQDLLINMRQQDGLVTVLSDGLYEVIAAPQVGRFPCRGDDDEAPLRTLDVWLQQNDVDVANSGVRLSLVPHQTDVLVTQGALLAKAGDTFRVLMRDATAETNKHAGAGGRIGLLAIQPSIGPLIPSIIVTIIGITQASSPAASDKKTTKTQNR